MSLVSFLIHVLFESYVFLLLLRVWLQKLSGSWYNPITRFCLQLTNPVVKPLRRFIPGIGGFDLSVVLAAWVFEVAQLALLSFLRMSEPSWLGVIVFALFALITKTISIFLFATIIAAIMSWFVTARQNPIAEVAELLSAPLVNSVRQLLPAIGGLDLSPMVVIFGLYVVQQFVVNPLMIRVLMWV